MSEGGGGAIEQNRAAARRWFDEVWNQGREATIDEMVMPNARVRGLTQAGRELVGPAAFREFYRPLKAALPDVHVEVDDVIAEGDRTAVRLTATGTHAGPDLGVAPTGRRITFSAIVWVRWHDGQIVEAWNEFDSASITAQISDEQKGKGGGPSAAVKPV